MINLKNLENRLLSYNKRLRYRFKGILPATSIGGIYQFKHKICHSNPPTVLLTPILIQKLSSLGSIGGISKLCKNRIGFCCEVHVANFLISPHPVSFTKKLNNIEFTRALRPRTNQYIKRCQNCIFIFGNEK